MVKEEILFVFGSARSGTTYMNRILYTWFDHGMASEADFVAEFAKKLGRYGDLAAERNLRKLVDDVAECDSLRFFRERYAEIHGRPMCVTPDKHY